MTSGKSLLLGFIVGGSIGAITALLNAPASGRVFRGRIKQQSLEWKEMIDSLMQDARKLKDQISRTSKEGVELINELTQEMKSSIETWNKAVEPHQANIHGYLEELEQSIKELEAKVKSSHA